MFTFRCIQMKGFLILKEAADAVRLADALMLQDSQQDVSEFHTLFFNFLEKSVFIAQNCVIRKRKRFQAS